jgi:hypothetical protein
MKKLTIEALIHTPPQEPYEMGLVDIDMKNIETLDLVEALDGRTLSPGAFEDLLMICEIHEGDEVCWKSEIDYPSNEPFKSENIGEQLKMDVLAEAFEKYSLDELMERLK